MELRKVWSILLRWLEKVRVALWLHPELNEGRRVLLRGSLAFAAAVVLAQVPDVTRMSGLMPSVGSISAEFTDVIRRAFMPRIYVQLWKAAPLMGSLLEV